MAEGTEPDGLAGFPVLRAARDPTRPDVIDLAPLLGAGDGGPGGSGPLPELRIADGTDRWRMNVGAWLAAQESDNTRDAYRREAAKWHAWCQQTSLDPFAVRRPHCDVYARSLDGAASSRARSLAALSSLYEYMVQNEEGADALGANPFASVKRPKVNTNYSPTRSLAESDTDKLMAAADARSPRAAAIVRILYYTGIRVTELVSADAEDLSVDQGHRVLAVTRKGGFRSDAVLPPPAAHAVDAYLAGRRHGPLIATGTGNRMRRQDVNVLLDSLARAADISHVHAHRLRHAFAVDAKEAGVPVDRIQAAMDHADPRTTGRYTGRSDALATAPGYALAARRAEREERGQATA